MSNKLQKVKDLNGEIVNNASKVHTALKLSQDDQQTITTLRSEVEKAWKMVRSPRFAVLRCLHFLGWTRGHRTMPWVVSLLISSCFGPRRATAPNRVRILSKSKNKPLTSS